MILRRVFAAGLVFAGLLATELVAAGTASAHGGPAGQTSTSAGCNGGGACWNGLSKYLSVSGGPQGSYNESGGNAGVSLADVPPPPCWMQYFNTGPGTWTWWQGYTHSGDPNVAAGIGGGGYSQQFYDHRNDNSGAWYTAVENPSGPPGGAQCVASLPEFQWVPAGTTPPLPQIPPRDLAMYALSTLQLPTPEFDLNPGNRSYVTLPTFVTNLQGNPTGPITLYAHFGNEVSPPVTVTVNAVTINTPNAQTYPNCGPNGTRESPAQMNKAGPNTTPDCGAVYQDPSTGYGARGYPFTVSTSWTATFRGQPIGPNPIQIQSAPRYIPVAEIQSINNNG